MPIGIVVADLSDWRVPEEHPSVPEGPLLEELQVHPVHVPEQVLSGTQDDRVDHELEFIDEAEARQLPDDGAASEDREIPRGFPLQFQDLIPLYLSNNPDVLPGKAVLQCRLQCHQLQQ